MRLIDRLIGQRGELPDPESVAWMSTTWQGAGTTERVQQTYLSYAVSAYSSNSAVFACAMARVQLLSQARFKFQDTTTKRLYGDPALQILGTPWPNGTSADLIASMVQHADIGGNAFVRRASSDRLVSMRPDWTDIISVRVTDGTDYEGRPQTHDEVLGYLYSEGGIGVGDAVFYDVADVAHWAPYPDPLARWRGMSWLTPILREINADVSMSQHRQTFFDQAGTPNMVLKYQQKLAPETVNTIRDRWRARYSGPSSAGSTVILDDGADLTVVGNSFEQMKFTDLQKMGEARIASAAGVPPIVAGLSVGLDAATYSNFSQAMKAFGNGTGSYLWQSLAASLSKLIAVPQGARLWYDTTSIPALLEDAKDRATAMQTSAAAIGSFIQAGFEPNSVVAAVMANDMSLLKHTGLVSVQLYKAAAMDDPTVPALKVAPPPGSPTAPVPGAAAPARSEPAMHLTVNNYPMDAPEVRADYVVHVEPTPVTINVERSDPAAPVVNVTVDPTPVTVNVERDTPLPQPAPVVNVNVEPTPITVRNDVRPSDVVVPPRTTTTMVERDRNGLISKTTATEKDA